MKRVSVLVLFILLFNLQPANAVDVLPEPFFKYLGSKYLGSPGVILINGASNEIVYQDGASKLRKPASVLKIISTSAIALTLDTSTVFKTAIYLLSGETMILGLPQMQSIEMPISGHICQH